MSRQMPKCAWCGESTYAKDRGQRGVKTITWEALPGRPMLAWHLDCEDKDKTLAAYEAHRRESDSLFGAVQRRGPGRVTRGRVK